MNWDLIQGLFLPHAQCLQDRFQIHRDPDQNKASMEDEAYKIWLVSPSLSLDVIEMDSAVGLPGLLQVLTPFCGMELSVQGLDFSQSHSLLLRYF